jgi:starvation-inducible outer membrane lipoprotein
MKGDIETAALFIAMAIFLHGCQTAPSSITAAYVQGLTGQEAKQ